MGRRHRAAASRCVGPQCEMTQQTPQRAAASRYRRTAAARRGGASTPRRLTTVGAPQLQGPFIGHLRRPREVLLPEPEQR